MPAVLDVQAVYMYSLGTSLPTVCSVCLGREGRSLLLVMETKVLNGFDVLARHLVRTERIASKHQEHPCGMSSLCRWAPLGSMGWGHPLELLVDRDAEFDCGVASRSV